MRTEMISCDEVEEFNGYTERIEYKCPCGHGKIVEEHEHIPGCRDHHVYLGCSVCAKKYELDTSKGVRNWDLVEKELINV